MSLFPAYATEEKSAAPNVLSAASASGNFDWLKSINSTIENVNRDTLLFPTFTADDDDQRTCEVNEINKNEDSYKSRKGAKSAKRKKKLEAKAEAEKQRVLSSSTSKRIFTDQFDSAGSLKQTFRIDKKSDRTNLAFASFAPVQVAKYYRRRPLVRDQYSGKPQTKIKRYFQQNVVKKTALVRKKFEWETQRTSYFLPLLSSERDDENEKKEPEDELKAEWNQRVREQPHDVSLWLEFLRSQSDSVSSDGFSSDGTREKVVFERQLAIVERALELNPGSLELSLFRLELCAEVWESERLATEWKRLLFLHPNDVSLHRRYLFFFQTKFSNFTVSKFVRLAGKCFATFNKVLEGTLQSHPAPPNMEREVLEVFLGYCSVLVGAGHQEKAVANYQALTEFNLFAPENFSPTSTSALQDRLAFFEPFWDSGLPRFGQPHATGWANVMKERRLDQPQTDNQNDLKEEEEESALKSSELLWRNWLRVERLRMRRHWFPGESEEDPERDVLLDDVGPTLFALRSSSNRLRLVLRFLALFGVEPEAEAENEVEDDPYLSDLELGRRRFVWPFYRRERCVDSIPLEQAFVRDPALDAEVIERVFRGALGLFRGEERRALTLAWMRHKMRQLRGRKAGPKETQSEVREARKFMKGLLSSEENRNDYALLTLYAKFQVEFGSVEQAKGVFRLLTGAPATQRPGAEEGVGAAYAEYALFCLETKDLSPELELVLEAFLKGNLSSKVLRMAKGGVLSGFDPDWTLVRRPDDPREELPAELQGQLLTCLAVYAYMRGGAKDAEAVLSNAARGAEEELKTGPPGEAPMGPERQEHERKCKHLLESVYTAWLRLLVSEGESCFKRLKGALAGALRLFPRAPALHHLFLDTEAGSYLSRGLRRHYGSLLRTSSTEARVGPALFALVGELERARNMAEAQRAQGVEGAYEGGGLGHRLRALFETALKHPNLRHSVVLWRLYMHFEAVQGQWMKCKTVVYRAFKHCPWAKVLFLDAVELLPEDVEEVMALMTEKELRLMAPSEEVQVLMDLKAKAENKINQDQPEQVENVT